MKETLLKFELPKDYFELLEKNNQEDLIDGDIYEAYTLNEFLKIQKCHGRTVPLSIERKGEIRFGY